MAEIDSMPPTRRCTKCHAEKSLQEFSKASGGKFGRSARCRSCAAEYAKANKDRINELSLARYYRITAEKRDAKAAAMAQRLAATDKLCTRCGVTKPKTEFKAKKDSADGRHCYCKPCCNAVNREHRVANPEMAAAWTKKWAANNPEKVKAKRLRWNAENPGRAAELAREWRDANRDRFRENLRNWSSLPTVRVHKTISARLRAALNSGKCGARTMEILGYTAKQLVQHIERQFSPGMSWDNYGEWHIDHITPLSMFKIESINDPAIRIAWGLPNLRPLWAQENIRKRDKRLYLL